MTAERAQIAANLVFLVALAVAVVSGVVSVLISRAIDRARDRTMVDLLHDVREHLVFARAEPLATTRPELAGPPPLRLQGPAPPAPVLEPARPAPVAEHAALPSPPAGGAALPAEPPQRNDATGRWRALSAEQRGRMVKILSLAPDSIVITSGGHGEPESFADQIAQVFREAGWTVERSLFVGVARPLPPLSANLGGEPRDVAVATAFATAGYALPPFDHDSRGLVREILVGASGPARLTGIAPSPAPAPLAPLPRPGG
jgi:hypothetical protein